MSISIFSLPHYKDMTHVPVSCYLEGKAGSCHGTELEDFLPVWTKLTSGKFPGHSMKLKRKIYKEEYHEYPIVFISSNYWPGTETGKAHGSTTVHIVQKQHQNIENCKTYEHRYIDRENGVIICEKTTLHDGAMEPDFKHWFYEKDTRPELPENILPADFSIERKPGAYFMEIKKFINDEKYDIKKGYLGGECIHRLFQDYMCCPEPDICGISFIEWDDSWNFVIHNYYGNKMFRVKTENAQEFFERNNILFNVSEL